MVFFVTQPDCILGCETEVGNAFRERRRCNTRKFWKVLITLSLTTILPGFSPITLIKYINIFPLNIICSQNRGIVVGVMQGQQGIEVDMMSQTVSLVV